MKIFDINTERFVFYPYKYSLVIGIVVFISFNLLILAYSIGEQGKNINSTYIGLFILLSFVLLSIFYIVSKHRIIIDIRKKGIYKKNIFGKKQISEVKDIKGVRIKDKNLGYSQIVHYYELIIKNNIDYYNKTIVITPDLNWESKDLKKFKKIALPQLERFLEMNQSSKKEQINTIKREIKLFKEIHPNYFVYKSGNIGYFIIGIISSITFAFILKNLIPDLIINTTFEKSFLMLITIICYLLAIYISFNAAGTATIIDLDKGKIIESIWGKHSKVIDFCDIRGIYMSKESTNGAYTSVYVSSLKYKGPNPINIDISTVNGSNTLLILAQDLEILLERKIDLSS